MRRATWLALILSLSLGACDETEPALGPPRCEPPRELVLERFLKEGFRALAEGLPEEAKIRFNAVLVEEATHPEALLGMRMAQRGGAIAPSTPTGPVADAGGTIIVAGAPVAVDVPVDHERFRFEDVRARRTYAHAHDLDEVPLPMDGWYTNRKDKDGKDIDPKSRDAVTQTIDLIVLHDSRTLDALDAMANMEASGASTHFLVDWDGTIYQTLDVALEAAHVHVDALDHRSVAIDLVNPVALESPPLPASAAGNGERPLSEFVVVHGQEIQEWGYTAPQVAAAKRLVRALGELLPAVPMRAPRDAAGKVPRQFVPGLRSFVGVLGHLHLSTKATDPGPGFDWEAFVREL